MRSCHSMPCSPVSQEWSRGLAPRRSMFASPLTQTAVGIDAGVTKNRDIRSDTHSYNTDHTRCSYDPSPTP